MGNKKPLGGPKAHAALVAARQAIISIYGPCVETMSLLSYDKSSFEALNNAGNAIEAVSKHFANPDQILATAWWSYWSDYTNEDELHATAIGAEPMFTYGYFMAQRTRREAWEKAHG